MATKVKLSNLQAELLNYLAAGATLHYEFRYGWSVNGIPGRKFPLGVLTNTARACLQRGLVARAERGGYTLTDVARQALSE
jgi:hypothetical protein